MSTADNTAAAREAVAEVPLWYHTLEVAPGVTTPGWFDLRPIIGLMPWPDVRGKRCLDVGTYDGFLAFELERRGATEVLAADIGLHEDWDWPFAMRQRGPEWLREHAGSEPGTGFKVASELLGSSVQRVTISAYDLSPEAVGQFDVVVCGSLLLHLRDPLRALAAIHSVCRGRFLSSETIDLRLTVTARQQPVLRLDGLSEIFQWFVPNAAAHRRMLDASGFGIERASRPYAIPFGVSHPPRGRSLRSLPTAAGRRIWAGGDGVPHQALLASPV
ncbi:MAG: class I SAM-dependent methyltransferase [Solirubrobacterales bacterium]